MLINFVCGFFLVAVMLTIGYFFGEVYSKISEDFKIAFLVLAAVLILSFSYFFSRYVKKKSAEL
jgi:membrane protein DedA with SNARE-associated domain